MGPDKTPVNMSPVTTAETRVKTDSDDFQDKDQLLSRIRLRYDDGVGAFEENRRMHSEDLNFVYNSESMGQWDPVVLEARRGKPNYTFNRVIGPVNIVVADMRQTRPAGKVRPTNSSANEATAEVLAGLMRSVEDESRADPIYKNQYKFAVAGGFGAWRLMPEYASEDDFDQVLRIKDIPNPQTVIWDPECSDATAGDAMWCIIGERVSKEKYRALFPDADSETSFNISRDSYGWFTDKEVRVVEYMERVPFKKTIAQFSDGTIEDMTPEIRAVEKEFEEKGLTAEQGFRRVVRTREVLKWRIMWLKCDGGQILEGPIYYDWKRIPVVRVPGRYINIEGRKKLQSLIRHAKDAQRTYNSRVCDMIERSALIPKAPYLVTENMIKGYENEWAQSNTASRPYLPYNIDKNAEGPAQMPFRNQPIDMPQGSIALAEQAAQDIQATTGYFDPAMGNSEDMNRVSGKALVAHTRRSDLGSFEFIDGFQDALQLTWEIGIDMIPTIYDSKRIVRIVGNDEIEKMVEINAQDETGDIVHDLQKGSYTCKVNIGPNYQTARQEALATMIDAAEAIPMIAQIAPDLLAKNIDMPDADELTRRLRIPLIQQGIIKPTEQEAQNMPPKKPDPAEMLQQAELARMQALAQRDAASAKIQQHKVDMIPLETHKQTYEAAGKHLQNMKLGAELGQQGAAAQAEQQAAQTDLAQQQVQGLQDLHQQNQQHQQDQSQAQDVHQQQLYAAHQKHTTDMARAHHAHQEEMKRTKEKHELAMQHQKELNAEKVKAAKELAKAKPKKPKAKQA
jgi:Phage P22-like portal protein